MRLRHLLLSQWVFAVEKPIGRIVKRFFVVGEHSSVTRKGIVANGTGIYAVVALPVPSDLAKDLKLI